MTQNHQAPKCIGYKYKTFRKYCSLCGLSFAAKTRKYLINYGDKFVTDVACSKACRDQALWMQKSIYLLEHLAYSEKLYGITSDMRGDASND